MKSHSKLSVKDQIYQDGMQPYWDLYEKYQEELETLRKVCLENIEIHLREHSKNKKIENTRDLPDLRKFFSRSDGRGQ